MRTACKTCLIKLVTGELQERAGETIMQATMVGRATAALYFLVLTIVGGAWMASGVSAEEAKKDASSLN